MVDFFNNPIASLVFSLIAVALTSLIKQRGWSRQTVGAIAFGLSFLLGLIQFALQGQVDLNHLDKLVINFGAILTVGQGIYHTVFKDTGLDQTLTDVGSAKPTAVGQGGPTNG
jgi:SNF family Na+-dependent transporter